MSWLFWATIAAALVAGIGARRGLVPPPLAFLVLLAVIVGSLLASFGTMDWRWWAPALVAYAMIASR